MTAEREVFCVRQWKSMDHFLAVACKVSILGAIPIVMLTACGKTDDGAPKIMDSRGRPVDAREAAPPVPPPQSEPAAAGQYTVDKLIDLIDHPDGSNRLQFETMLSVRIQPGKLTPEQSARLVPKLIDRYNRPGSNQEVVMLGKLLVNVGPPAIPALTTYIEKPGSLHAAEATKALETIARAYQMPVRIPLAASAAAGGQRGSSPPAGPKWGTRKPPTFEELIPEIDNPDPDKRQRAIEQLGVMLGRGNKLPPATSRPMVSKLVARLDQVDRPSEGSSIFTVLTHIGKDAVAPLTDYVNNPRSKLRQEAVNTLQGIGLRHGIQIALPKIEPVTTAQLASRPSSPSTGDQSSMAGKGGARPSSPSEAAWARLEALHRQAAGSPRPFDELAGSLSWFVPSCLEVLEHPPRNAYGQTFAYALQVTLDLLKRAKLVSLPALPKMIALADDEKGDLRTRQVAAGAIESVALAAQERPEAAIAVPYFTKLQARQKGILSHDALRALYGICRRTGDLTPAVDAMGEFLGTGSSDYPARKWARTTLSDLKAASLPAYRKILPRQAFPEGRPDLDPRFFETLRDIQELGWIAAPLEPDLKRISADKRLSPDGRKHVVALLALITRPATFSFSDPSKAKSIAGGWVIRLRREAVENPVWANAPVRPVTLYVRSRLRESVLQGLESETIWGASETFAKSLIEDLNAIIRGPSIWDKDRFAMVRLRPETQEFLRRNPTGEDLARLNRLLLDDAYRLK